MAWIQSLAQELPYAVGVAKKKKKTLKKASSYSAEHGFLKSGQRLEQVILRSAVFPTLTQENPSPSNTHTHTHTHTCTHMHTLIGGSPAHVPTGPQGMGNEQNGLAESFLLFFWNCMALLHFAAISPCSDRSNSLLTSEM